MDAIWMQAAPMSVGDVLAVLSGRESTAYNTIKTTMERLAEKGILSRAKKGKAYLYEAIVTREELERRIVANALGRLMDQFPEAVASFFIRPDTVLSDEKLALLQEAVERSRRQQDV